jgi:hypothetical protein
MMDAIGNTVQASTATRAASQQAVPRTAQQDADPTAGASLEPSRYYSPVVRLDSETQRTVLQYRDGSDGKVLVQYPTERQLEAYRNKAIAERSKEQEQADALKSGRQADAAGGDAAGRSGASVTRIDGGASARDGGRTAPPPTGQSSGRDSGVIGAGVPSQAASQPVTTASSPRSVPFGAGLAGSAFGGGPVLNSISA